MSFCGKTAFLGGKARHRSSRWLLFGHSERSLGQGSRKGKVAIPLGPGRGNQGLWLRVLGCLFLGLELVVVCCRAGAYSSFLGATLKEKVAVNQLAFQLCE